VAAELGMAESEIRALALDGIIRIADGESAIGATVLKQPQV
jgi:hypothetical protein